MMSLFVRLNVGFWEHRKTIRLRALIGESALWIPPRLWSYAANNQPDGDFTKYLPGEIAMLVGYSGDAQALLQALQASGFMDEMKIHDWEEHNSYHTAFSARAKTAAAARWQKKNLPAKTGRKKGEEKTREEKSQALLQASLSIATSIPWAVDAKFTEKLKEWIDYRFAGEKPKDGDWERFFGRQIKWMSDYTPDVACQIIDASLRNGYTGLFEPKGPQAPVAKPAKPTQVELVYTAHSDI